MKRNTACGAALLLAGAISAAVSLLGILLMFVVSSNAHAFHVTNHWGYGTDLRGFEYSDNRARTSIKQVCWNQNAAPYQISIIGRTRGFSTISSYGGVIGCDACFISVATGLCGHRRHD